MADLRTKVAQQLGSLLLANIEIGHDLEAARAALAAALPKPPQVLTPAEPADAAAPPAAAGPQPQESPE